MSVGTVKMDHVAHTSQILVGRDAELTELASSLGVRASGDLRTSGPGVVLLSGDAGVGKTRLLVALRDLAFTEGWQVLAGHCLDFGDSALPYLPFSEVLGRLATDLPDVVDSVAGVHPALARLQPGRRVLTAAESAPGEPSALDRGDLMEAVHALLEAAASRAPLLLVIEDLHWADQSTRDLLSFLFTRPFSGPVAVVASYRSDDLHRRHPLRRQVAEWSRLRGVERMSLAPLGEESVRALVAELVPDGLQERELAQIVARAEGNAFFVEELTSAASGPDSWVPADLADVLLVRLDRLDEAARQVVRVASVAGRRVGHDMLVAAAGMPVETLDEGLRQAVEMHVMVAEGGRYAFRHALLGEAVYDDLLPGERVRLHLQYAAALAEGRARGTAAELARHARLGLDLDAALAASIRAGDEAAAVGGPEEAAHHYQQALELLADPARREALDVDLSKLVVGTADALTSAGRPMRAADVLREQLDRLPADAAPAWRPRLLGALADALFITESQAESLAVSAEAVALLPDDTPALRAKVLNIRARVLSGFGHYDEAQAVGMDALALSERLDLPEMVAEAITTLSGLKKAGPKDALRAALADAIEQAAATGAVQAELRGRFLMARSFEDWAEFDEAERWFRSGMQVGFDAGLPWAPYAFEARWQLALVELVRGRWDRVLELTDTGREPAPPIPSAILMSVRLVVEQARGLDVLDRARELRKRWEFDGSIPIHSASVEIADAARRCDAAAALAAYDDAVTVLGSIWHEWFSARIRLAAQTLDAVCRALPTASAGERAELVAHAERLHADGHTVLDRYTDPSGHWGPEGRAWVKRLDAETLRARWLAGVDAPPQEALVETWREAETVFADYGHVHELARVRLVLATVHRASGDLATSRTYADQARATAHELGATVLLDELQALGTTPVRGESAPETLTARETEILALVAEGRSNGEIGKQLFISAKTVSVHVSNILGKLGAAGRTEAAAIARRRGLLPD